MMYVLLKDVIGAILCLLASFIIVCDEGQEITWSVFFIFVVVFCLIVVVVGFFFFVLFCFYF